MNRDINDYVSKGNSRVSTQPQFLKEKYPKIQNVWCDATGFNSSLQTLKKIVGTIQDGKTSHQKRCMTSQQHPAGNFLISSFELYRSQAPRQGCWFYRRPCLKIGLKSWLLCPEIKLCTLLLPL